MLDDAVDLALRDQESAGIDVVSDGEMRRAGFFTAEFYQHLTGRPAAAAGPAARAPAATTSSTASRSLEPIAAPDGLGVVEEYRYAAAHATRPLKVTIPGPYTLSGPADLRPRPGLPAPRRRGRGVRADPARRARGPGRGRRDLHPDRRPVAGDPPGRALGLRGALQRGGRAGRRAASGSGRTCASGTTSAGRWRAGRTGRCSTRCSGSAWTSWSSSSPTARWPRSAILGEIAAAGRDVAAGVIDVKNSHLESADEVAERIDRSSRPACRPSGWPSSRTAGSARRARWATIAEAARARRRSRPGPRPGRLTSRPADDPPGDGPRVTASEPADLGVAEAVAAIRDRSVDRGRGRGRLPRSDRGHGPTGSSAWVDGRCAMARWREARERGRRGRRRATGRPAPRGPDRDQGHHRRRRAAHARGRAAFAHRTPSADAAAGRPAAGRRGGHRREDPHDAVRVQGPGARRATRGRPRTRRAARRRGPRPRSRPGRCPAAIGTQTGRLDPATGRVLRRGRAQGCARRGPARRRRAARAVARPLPGRSRGPWRTPPWSGASSPDRPLRAVGAVGGPDRRLAVAPRAARPCRSRRSGRISTRSSPGSWRRRGASSRSSLAVADRRRRRRRTASLEAARRPRPCAGVRGARGRVRPGHRRARPRRAGGHAPTGSPRRRASARISARSSVRCSTTSTPCSRRSRLGSAPALARRHRRLLAVRCRGASSACRRSRSRPDSTPDGPARSRSSSVRNRSGRHGPAPGAAAWCERVLGFEAEP